MFALQAPAPEAAAAAALQQLPEPVVVPGSVSPASEIEAARVFGVAQEAYEAGRYEQALELAQQIVELFPSAPVSGRALLLTARASLEAGRFLEADERAERYIRLLAGDDPRRGEVRLLQAAAMEGRGDAVGSIDRLLRIAVGTPVDVAAPAREEARRVVDGLDPFELEDLVGTIPPGALLAPVVQARYARDLQRDGFVERADAFARAALAGGARGADSVIAMSVLQGRRPRTEATRPTVLVQIATVLPESGSPGLVEFGSLIAEGVEVAAATLLSEGVEVEVIEIDDEGEPERAAALIPALERRRIIGAVGFLEDLALLWAGQIEGRELPLVSPTARTAEVAGGGVYSLEGPDPFAAIAIAEHAALEGYLRLAVVHSQAPASVAEADAFEARARALEIPVVGRFDYEVGATFFGNQIRGAADALRMEEIAALELGEEDTLHVELLDPVALFLPLPFEDIELAAPQVTFYGLDTLGIDLLGTSGWTDARVLDIVDPRHTSGVVATAPLSSGPGTPGYIRFESAYERHFQRSLVNSIPALGYDAALLLLEGARANARSPAQVRRVIERVRDLEGATGIFSVIGGRVIRRTEVVRIEHRQLLPVGGFRFR